MPPLIRLEGVEFSYPSGVKALRGVSLQVERGEGLALLGENGAGKSTLAKHLNGLLKPEAGIVRIDGETTLDRQPAELAHLVGYVFQNPDDQLFAQTVWQEVAFGPRNLGFDKATVDRRVAQSLSSVGLQHAARLHPYDLHQTDRKLVAIASVLAMETQVVILDEPTTGQDFATLTLLGRIVQQLLERSVAVIVISHDVDFCAHHFHRAVLMAGGLVLADGPVEKVFAMEPELKRAAVDEPQIGRLSRRLGWAEPALDPESFLRALAEQREG